MQSWEGDPSSGLGNQGSFFSDPCLGFLQYCRFRLLFKLVLNIRQLDEKKTQPAQAQVEDQVGCFSVAPDQGSVRETLLTYRQARRLMSPSNLFLLVKGGGVVGILFTVPHPPPKGSKSSIEQLSCTNPIIDWS